MKKYINVILSLASVGLLLITIHGQDKQIRAYKSEKASVDSLYKQSEDTIDSLKQELFDTRTELGRYELTLQHVVETDPKRATELQNFLDKETE